MKSIYVCQIYDRLAEKVIHTFMASNADHARDQFRRFLDSVKKYSDVKNFVLLYVSYDEICETSSDCVSFMEDNFGDFDVADDVLCIEEVSEDESES